jgi:hypothetical protein
MLFTTNLLIFQFLAIKHSFWKYYNTVWALKIDILSQFEFTSKCRIKLSSIGNDIGGMLA